MSEEGSSLRSSPIAGDKRETRTKPVQVCEQEQEQSQHLHEEQPKPVPFIPDTDEDDDEMHNCHGFRVTDEQAAFYDPGVYSSRLGRDLDREEYLVADDLYFDLLPDREAEEEDVVLLAELALEFTAQTVRAAWSFNQRHKNGKLKLFGVPDLAAALRSDSDRCLLNQLRAHDENIEACEKCEGLRRCSHCLHVEDMTQSKYGRRLDGFYDYYLHQGVRDRVREGARIAVLTRAQARLRHPELRPWPRRNLSSRAAALQTTGRGTVSSLAGVRRR